jgi:hypothetical protein
MGWKAPVLNAFLFGVYHFFSPWNLPVIFVAILPVGFVVRAKKNFRTGLVDLAMFNITSVLTIFLRQPQQIRLRGRGSLYDRVLKKWC